jgi:hypothetical protein
LLIRHTQQQFFPEKHENVAKFFGTQISFDGQQVAMDMVEPMVGKNNQADDLYFKSYRYFN